MAQESEKKQLSPEEVGKILEARKEEIRLKSIFYKETEAFYAAQLAHEIILTQIEEQQYKRLEMKIRYAQFIVSSEQNAKGEKEKEDLEKNRDKK